MMVVVVVVLVVISLWLSFHVKVQNDFYIIICQIIRWKNNVLLILFRYMLMILYEEECHLAAFSLTKVIHKTPPNSLIIRHC